MKRSTSSADDVFELRRRWQEAVETCKAVISEAYDDGEAYAKAEAAYQAQKAQTAAKMRADGTPVGIVELTAKGDCSKELYEREAARNVYNIDRLAASFYTNLEAHLFQDYKRAMEGDIS